MTTRRGANAAPDLSKSQHPVSELVRLRDRPSVREPFAIEHTNTAAKAAPEDDDLYGNMPFTD